MVKRDAIPQDFGTSRAWQNTCSQSKTIASRLSQSKTIPSADLLEELCGQTGGIVAPRNLNW